jgi:DNA repair protein RadB
MWKLNSFVDDVIGPLEEDTITTLYGPAGVGKSTLCFMYCISCLKSGKRVLFVDTEGGFSATRIRQLDDSVKLSDIFVLSPKSFEQQKKTIEDLGKSISNHSEIGLVVVDSLVMLYRLKLGDAPAKINNELGEQLRILTELARTYHIPILVVNQMYTSFNTQEKKMVGGTLMEYWSKTIVEMDKEKDVLVMGLKKHKSRPSNIERKFIIVEKGFQEVKSSGISLLK